MCAEKSEGASYGMEALALGGLTETGPLLARNGHAAMVASCPLSEAKRKTSAPSEYFGLCTKDGHIRSAPAFQRLKRFPPGPRLFATNQPYALL
jgi:hypothetical protein